VVLILDWTEQPSIKLDRFGMAEFPDDQRGTLDRSEPDRRGSVPGLGSRRQSTEFAGSQQRQASFATLVSEMGSVNETGKELANEPTVLELSQPRSSLSTSGECGNDTAPIHSYGEFVDSALSSNHPQRERPWAAIDDRKDAHISGPLYDQYRHSRLGCGDFEAAKALSTMSQRHASYSEHDSAGWSATPNDGRQLDSSTCIGAWYKAI